MNKTKKKRKKTFVILFGLAVALLSAPHVQAQGLLENLLDEYYAEKDQQSNNNGGVMGRGTGTVGVDFTGQGFGATDGDITGQTFGAPLGSGLLVMLAAGASYATIKSRKNKTERTNEHEKDWHYRSGNGFGFRSVAMQERTTYNNQWE